MTENERVLRDIIIDGNGFDYDESIPQSIFAEIQQYREIGTVEEIKSMKENGPFSGVELAQLAAMQMRLRDYQKIGTIEEFKALKQKNTPKKPFGGMYDWTCPTCGTYHSTHGKCCSECMQMILWD